VKGSRVALHAASHALRVLVNLICVAVATPLLLRSLGLSGFGGWALAMTGLAYLLFFELGATTALTKLAAEARAEDCPAKERAALKLLGTRVLLTSCVVSPLAWAGAPLLAAAFPDLARGELTAVLRSVAAAALVLLPLSLGPALLLGRAQHLLTNSVSIVGRLVQLLLLAAALSYSPTLLSAVLATLGGQVLTSVALALAALATRAPCDPNQEFAPQAEIRDQVRSFGWINLAVLLGSQTDVLLAGLFAGPAGAGLYRIAERTTAHLGAFLKQLGGVVAPEIARAHAAGDGDELRELFLCGCRWTLILGFPPLAVLLTWGDWGLALWLGDIARPAAPLAALVWGGLLVSLVQSHAVNVLAFTGEHRAVARVFVGVSLANFSLSALLAIPFGVWGIAVGTFFTVTLSDLAWFIPRGARRVGVGWAEFTNWTVSRNAIVGVLLTLTLSLLRLQFPNPGLLGGGALIFGALAVAGITWLWIAARPSERHVIAKLTKRALGLLNKRKTSRKLSACDS
jgi:O-antigen/teichoic acid export membrane protein